jgi:glycosyltransferase involved in cell wall biosynthesis
MPVTDPKISIITVVRNGASTIEDTIRSVASQDYPRIEHIVIDGASTDGTLDIVQRHRDKIAAFKSEPDGGMYEAMNKGLALATGELVGFLNADDIYADSRVLREIADTLSAPEVDACYGDLVYVGMADANKVVRYWKSRPYRDGLFEVGWMPAHPTFYAKRRIYDKYGGYDLAYRRQSDFELTMRFLAVHHVRSVYIPRVLVRMRSGGASRELMHILEGNIEAYRACRKHALNVTPFFIFRKILSRIPQFFLRDKLATSPK